jgi:hypothetical protein
MECWFDLERHLDAEIITRKLSTPIHTARNNGGPPEAEQQESIDTRHVVKSDVHPKRFLRRNEYSKLMMAVKTKKSSPGLRTLYHTLNEGEDYPAHCPGYWEHKK